MAQAESNLKPLEFNTLFFFYKQAVLWDLWMSFAKRNAELLSSANWLEVKFEDFLKNPQACLRPICNLIGVEYEEQMLDPVARRSDPVLGTAAAYAHEKLGQDLDESRADSHEELPGQLAWVIEHQAGNMLQQCGYRLAHPRLPAWQRLVMTVALWGNRRRVNREVNAHLRKRCYPNEYGKNIFYGKNLGKTGIQPCLRNSG
jgi:hypothetical protein